MYSFRNDYSEGAHPKVMDALVATNLEQTCGYSGDHYCAQAMETVRTLCAAPDAQVLFTVGGTQTNLLVIHALLHSVESVIAATSGHVATHETGAIEATGHKVCTVDTPDGKLTPALVDTVVQNHETEHMVHPKLVYISNTTELGTVYNKAEIAALRDYCDAHDLYLFCDGARLGSALTVDGCDLTLADMAHYCHVFTIGGTKNGLLFGEVIVSSVNCPYLRAYTKQRGALLAKGRLLGVQFQAILEDNLYFDIARHANVLAQTLQAGLVNLGCKLLVEGCSNQVFVLLDNTVVDALLNMGYEFEYEGPRGAEISCIRFVTSWATPASAVETFLANLKTLLTK